MDTFINFIRNSTTGLTIIYIMPVFLKYRVWKKGGTIEAKNSQRFVSWLIVKKLTQKMNTWGDSFAVSDLWSAAVFLGSKSVRLPL